MAHPRAKVKQDDIQRAIRAAKRTGAKGVRVQPDGAIDIVISDGQIQGWFPDAKPSPADEGKEEKEMYPGKGVV